jgi:hypothetical protein
VECSLHQNCQSVAPMPQRRRRTRPRERPVCRSPRRARSGTTRPDRGRRRRDVTARDEQRAEIVEGIEIAEGIGDVGDVVGLAAHRSRRQAADRSAARERGDHTAFFGCAQEPLPQGGCVAPGPAARAYFRARLRAEATVARSTQLARISPLSSAAAVAWRLIVLSRAYAGVHGRELDRDRKAVREADAKLEGRFPRGASTHAGA